MKGMQALKAHVRNGQFIIDERTDLPEGTEVELQLVNVADAFAGLAPEEREELEEAIEEGFRDFENGDHVGAREFLAQLRAKNRSTCCTFGTGDANGRRLSDPPQK